MGGGGFAVMNKWLHSSGERIVMSVSESLELLPLSMVLLYVLPFKMPAAIRSLYVKTHTQPPSVSRLR